MAEREGFELIDADEGFPARLIDALAEDAPSYAPAARSVLEYCHTTPDLFPVLAAWFLALSEGPILEAPSTFARPRFHTSNHPN